MRKIETLKKNYEFKNVLDNGKYIVKNQIIVYVKQNKNKVENRIGIAVNTKVGKAVIRNHIKRLIRENYLNLKDKIKPVGYDIVILWNKKLNYNSADFHKISKEMLEAFLKLNMLKEE